MKRTARILLLTSVTLLSGCTVGPVVRRSTVYVNQNNSQGQPVKIGRVAQNQRVKVELVTEAGETMEDTVDIGGWGVVPPKENAPAKP